MVVHFKENIMQAQHLYNLIVASRKYLSSRDDIPTEEARLIWDAIEPAEILFGQMQAAAEAAEAVEDSIADSDQEEGTESTFTNVEIGAETEELPDISSEEET
jgi:hypothetical protein